MHRLLRDISFVGKNVGSSCNMRPESSSAFMGFPVSQPRPTIAHKTMYSRRIGRRDQGAHYDGRAPRVSAEEHRSGRDLDLCSVCGRINKLITHTPCRILYKLKMHAVHKRLLSACIFRVPHISASFVLVICSRVTLICPFGNSSGWICSFVPV